MCVRGVFLDVDNDLILRVKPQRSEIFETSYFRAHAMRNSIQIFHTEIKL